MIFENILDSIVNNYFQLDKQKNKTKSIKSIKSINTLDLDKMLDNFLKL